MSRDHIERISSATLEDARRQHPDHVQRYDFALGALAPKSRVLDVACGIGYGSEVLSEAGHVVIGADVSYEALMSARTRSRRIVQADARKVPIRSESIDAIVTFETIEHMAEPKRFVSEMARVLTPNGLLILSTPWPDLPVLVPTSPYHVREYTDGEIDEFLFPFFQIEQRYGQLSAVHREIATIRAMTSSKAVLRRLRRHLPQGLERQIYRWINRRASTAGDSLTIEPNANAAPVQIVIAVRR